MRALSVALDAALALERFGAPDLPAMATLARLGGCGAVRIGINEELSPLAEPEVRALARAASSLELWFSPVPGLIKVALETRPGAVVLAAAPREWGAPPGPLDFEAWGSGLAASVRTLREGGSRVVALVRAQPQSVKSAHAAEFDGVELLAGSALAMDGAAQIGGVAQLSDAAQLAAKLGLSVGLSGGLDFDNLSEALAAAPLAERLCVGRAFVERALLVGVDRAVRDLRDLVG